MIKIVIDHQVVDLPAKLNHELVWVNPLLDYNYVNGAYSTPFSLPATDRNNRIFKNSIAFDSVNNTQVYYCEKYFNDNLIEEGYVKLKDTIGAYNLYFTSNIGEIFAGKKDTDFADFMPDIVIGSRVATGTPAVVFPTIANAGFYQANAPGGWANVVNDHDGAIYTGPTYTPAFRVKSILTQLATTCGFTLNGSFISNTDMDRLYIFQLIEDNSLTISVKNALRGITPSTFIANLRKALGLSVVADSLRKTLTIDLSADYHNAEVAHNWSQYCSLPIGGRQNLGLAGIKLAYQLNSEDKLTTDTTLGAVMQPYLTTSTVPDPKYFEVTSQYCPLAMSSGLPIMDEQGRTSINKQDTKALFPRLGFYKGVVSTGVGNRPLLDVSYGSHSLANSTKATGSFLAEEGFWKNAWETQFELRMNHNINLADLRSRVHIHGQNYFAKEIVLNTSNPAIALLKAMKC